MLLSFFNYPESKGNKKICLRYYPRCHDSVNKYIKSEHACLAIEKITKSIEYNMKYSCHYHFIDVTAFSFLGNNIFKGANGRLTKGDVTVSKNMSINTSAMTQTQIFQTHILKESQLRVMLCYL